MKNVKIRDYSNWTKADFIKQIDALKNNKKYGIVWDEEKTKETIKSSYSQIPILNEIKKHEIMVNKTLPTNILIEGDNFHSLTVLNYTHKKQIDVIYIDPPYNTGNEFVYNDKIVAPDDAYRHSKWLSFMHKRLILAKELLTIKGIIFISIDDNELYTLKLLCDKIFGSKNFLSNFVRKRRSGANDPKNLISTDHEYILCYRRSDKSIFKGIKKNLSNYCNPDNDPRGNWTAGDLTSGKTKHERPNLFYAITDPKTKKTYPANPNRVWRFKKERMEDEIRHGNILFPKNNGMPQYKRFANNLKSKFKPISTWIESSTAVSNDILSDEDEYDIRIMQSDLNQTATRDLRDIFGTQKFNYPKPISLIKGLISNSISESSTILDFFAGSGTTGHAVLELNKRYKNLKFILCTNNENNICNDVCYPRLKKVIKGYKNSKNNKIIGLNGNLKYYKTDFIDNRNTDENKKNIANKSTEILCLKENCFIKIIKTKNYAIFKNHSSKYMGIVYADEGISSLKRNIKSINEKFIIYIFSLDDSTREEEFDDVSNMIELTPIPEVILNAYRRVLNG